MNIKSELPTSERRPSMAAGIATRVVSVAIVLVAQMVILFVAAGRLDWTWGWVYLGINLAVVAISGPIVFRTSPETVAERSRILETQDWDRAIAGLYFLSFYFALGAIAGLDVRFGWTQALGVAWNLAGAVVLAAGLGLSGWAMIANTYFSTAVRIQSDRGQTVCRTGPYRFVRHPGYVGYILQPLGTALLLGSLWALIPGIVAVAAMVTRTSLEDRMLQAGLPGYQEYAQSIRYRLVPGVW